MGVQLLDEDSSEQFFGLAVVHPSPKPRTDLSRIPLPDLPPFHDPRFTLPIHEPSLIRMTSEGKVEIG